MLVRDLYSYISVKQKDRWDEDNRKVVDYYRLDVEPLKKGKGFDLAKEDPAYYKNEVGYSPDREWPNEPLPSLEGAAQSISSSVIKMALEVHHSQVKFLHSLGVDACREFQQSNVEYILEVVQPNETLCKICNKDQASTQALKGHIRSKHMDATPWKCNQCDKFFGDYSTYKSHLKIHQHPNQHKCDVCNKGYPSLSRLNAHKKVHDPSTYVNCKWCNKQFKNKKNLPAHEKTCKRQPGGRDAAEKDKQCPYCDKAYYHQKDLTHHVSEKHKSRAHQKQ